MFGELGVIFSWGYLFSFREWSDTYISNFAQSSKHNHSPVMFNFCDMHPTHHPGCHVPLFGLCNTYIDPTDRYGSSVGQTLNINGNEDQTMAFFDVLFEG